MIERPEQLPAHTPPFERPDDDDEAQGWIDDVVAELHDKGTLALLDDPRAQIPWLRQAVVGRYHADHEPPEAEREQNTVARVEDENTNAPEPEEVR